MSGPILNPAINATRNRRSRERRFRLIIEERGSILIAVLEIWFRPCSDADWSIGARIGPARAPTGYQKNRKDLPARALEGAIFIRDPHFIYRPLSLFFLFSSSLSSLSLAKNPSCRWVFLAGIEEFFKLTPTCSTTVHFVLSNVETYLHSVQKIQYGA